MKYLSTAVLDNGREVVVATLPLEQVPQFDLRRPPPGTYAAADEVQVGWVRQEGQFVPPAPPSLERLVAAAEGQIDAAASAARSRFVSDGIGQDATYLLKASQAEIYRAAGYIGDVPSYVAAEAAARGLGARAAAEIILAARDAWAVIGARIEGERIGGKIQVRGAGTAAEVNAALAAALAALNAISTATAKEGRS